MIIMMRRQYERCNIRRVLVLFLFSEEGVLFTDDFQLLRLFAQVARMVDDHTDDVQLTCFVNSLYILLCFMW